MENSGDAASYSNLRTSSGGLDLFPPGWPPVRSKMRVAALPVGRLMNIVGDSGKLPGCSRQAPGRWRQRSSPEKECVMGIFRGPLFRGPLIISLYAIALLSLVYVIILALHSCVLCNSVLTWRVGEMSPYWQVNAGALVSAVLPWPFWVICV